MTAEVAYQVASAGLVVLMAAAALTDIKSRRIPNALTMSGLLAGLGIRLMVGTDAAVAGLVGVLLAFVLVLPLLVLGAVGGGDAKLLMALGAFTGPRDLLGALLLIASVGGIVAVLDASRKGVLLPVLYNTGSILKHWATFGRRGANRSLHTVGALAIPYGVAIAIGGLLWWFLKVRYL